MRSFDSLKKAWLIDICHDKIGIDSPTVGCDKCLSYCISLLK